MHELFTENYHIVSITYVVEGHSGVGISNGDRVRQALSDKHVAIAISAGTDANSLAVDGLFERKAVASQVNITFTCWKEFHLQIKEEAALEAMNQKMKDLAAKGSHGTRRQNCGPRFPAAIHAL